MGAWTEIVDFTFTANETSRAFTGLNITKDDFIKVVATIGTTDANTSFVAIYANSDTSGSDYYQQALDGNGTSVTAFRDNDNYPIITNGNSFSTHIAYIKLSENDKFNVFANGNTENGSSIRTRFQYVTSVNSFTSGITSLTFETTVTARPIATGSRIQIYRLDAEKVADITVGSNTTQVDISNLSIGKDSEYLLVSDLTYGVSSGGYDLMINDSTTRTNYYGQSLNANNTTAVAERANNALVGFGGTGFPALSYAHIKLSEIGAYTAQNYQVRDYGTNGIRILNIFVSSTSEAITSITKLNVVGTTTNAIGSGTRFILYKLK